MAIVIKVAEIMGRERVKQSDLSKKTGIRPATISALWHGTAKRIEVGHIDKLCDALNCQPGDLLKYIPEE